MMADMTIEKRVQLTEEALNIARNERNRAEAQVTVLEKELQVQENKARELGVEPQNLDQEIKKIRVEIATLFKQVTDCIPPEYLAKVGL